MTRNLFWLRESASGGWITPYAFSEDALPADLPADLKKNFLAMSYTEVHLPYTEWRQPLPDRPLIFLCPCLEGRVILQHPETNREYIDRYQIMLSMAAAAHGVEEPRFRLLGAYGRSLDARECSAWANPPFEREGRFFGVYKMVSRAFQQTMREMLPALYFANVQRYMDTEMAYPMLLLAASSPFRGRNRSTLTYDVLDLDSVDKFYRSAQRGLPRVLAGVEAKLLEDGLTELAKAYAPSRAERVLAFVKRDRNPMRSLLLAEASLFDDFLRFAHRMHDLCAEGPLRRRQIRKIPTATSEFVRTLHSRLRRYYNGVPMYGLTMPLFMSVTHALYESRKTVK